MKVLLINGSPHRNGCVFTAISEVAGTLETEGIGTEIFWIGKGDIRGCTGCHGCRRTGRCVFDDCVNEIGPRLDEFDGIIFGAPVYYSGPAGQVSSFMDRLFYVYGRKLWGKVTANVVNARRGGNTASFERMNQYALVSNMIVVGSQYWNMTHGYTPDDVRADKEGMQTMRTLGRNMAWVLKCIEAGKKAGVAPPMHEEFIATNFIR